MSMMKKLMSAGVVTKVVAEAKKAENQAKIKAAAQKLKDRKKPGTTR